METETNTLSFEEKRTNILNEFKKFSEKIKTLTSFQEALKECEILFLLLISQHNLDLQYLKGRGSDEPKEGQPLSRRSFHYITEDMSKVFIKEWEQSIDTEKFIQYFIEFDRIWNLLGTENREIISCTVDMMENFFSHCHSVYTTREFERFLDSLNFTQIRALYKIVGEYKKKFFLELFSKKFPDYSLQKVIEEIMLEEKFKDREVLYTHVSKRDDFKKLSIEEIKNVIDKTRSFVLATKFLSRDDLPVDLFLLKVAMEKTAS